MSERDGRYERKLKHTLRDASLRGESSARSRLTLFTNRIYGREIGLILPSNRKTPIRLIAVPFVLSLVDVFVTLYYQPAEYWGGDRSALVEANPVVWVALRIHPLLMVPGFIGWWGIVLLLMFKTPSWIGLRVYVLLVLGHLIGITGWLARNHPQGWWLSGVIALIALGTMTLHLYPLRAQWNGDRPVAF